MYFTKIMYFPAYLSLISLCIVLNCSAQTPANTTNQSKQNIIMVIADGMGPAYITAHRYLKNIPQTTNVQPTIFDKYWIGTATTYPHPNSGWLTDSAASATAMAAGVKTLNGVIGLDSKNSSVLTVAEQAKKQGKKVGLVVTSPITDATPASYFTHHKNRRSYNDIADSYLHLLSTKQLDIALGGGSRFFFREDKNLVNTFTSQDGYFIESYEQLNTLPKDKAVLGLFAEIDLPKAIDDTDPKRLLTMTQAAIKQLENKQGYFLLVEASLVDWAGHDKDIVGAMSEMQDLDTTLAWLETYVQSHPNTTVVITADHNTGGLTLSSKDKDWDPRLIQHLKQSPFKMASYYLENAQVEKSLAQSTKKIKIDDPFTLKLTKKEQAKLTGIQKSFIKKEVTAQEAHNLLFRALIKIINNKTHTGWTTYGHTAVDVPVMAMGKNAKDFKGMQDNTDIAKKIFALLALELKTEQTSK